MNFLRQIQSKVEQNNNSAFVSQRNILPALPWHLRPINNVQELAGRTLARRTINLF